MGAHFGLRPGRRRGRRRRWTRSACRCWRPARTPASARTTPTLPWPCAWVLRPRRAGRDAALLARCARALRIPQPGGEESLNVAAAAAICLYESARRSRLSEHARRRRRRVGRRCVADRAHRWLTCARRRCAGRPNADASGRDRTPVLGSRPPHAALGGEPSSSASTSSAWRVQRSAAPQRLARRCDDGAVAGAPVLAAGSQRPAHRAWRACVRGVPAGIVHARTTRLWRTVDCRPQRVTAGRRRCTAIASGDAGAPTAHRHRHVAWSRVAGRAVVDGAGQRLRVVDELGRRLFQVASARTTSTVGSAVSGRSARSCVELRTSACGRAACRPRAAIEIDDSASSTVSPSAAARPRHRTPSVAAGAEPSISAIAVAELRRDARRPACTASRRRPDDCMRSITRMTVVASRRLPQLRAARR